MPVVADDAATALASLIEENLASPDCLKPHCRHLHLDTHAAIDVGALFALTFGTTPQHYVQTARRLLAKTLLPGPAFPRHVAHACGYADQRALERDFAEVSYRLDSEG